MPKTIRLRKKPLLFVVFIVVLIVAALNYYHRNTRDIAPDIGKRKDISTDSDIREKEPHVDATNAVRTWPDLNGDFNPSDPGEGGVAVATNPEEDKLKNMAYAEYGFNQFVSDKISLHRSLPDTRSPL